MTLAGKIGDARWLIAQQVGQGTPKAFCRAPRLLASRNLCKLRALRTSQLDSC
jgi:hypothetical protein